LERESDGGLLDPIIHWTTLQEASAMEHLHEKAIDHCDVKAENV